MTTTDTCQHFWVIEPAKGCTSPGVCRHCGETRQFKNSINDWKYGAHPDRVSHTETTEARKRHHRSGSGA